MISTLLMCNTTLTELNLLGSKLYVQENIRNEMILITYQKIHLDQKEQKH